MRFRYRAKTREGELRVGIIEAPNKEAALDLVQRLGFFLIELKEERPFLKIKFKRGVSQKDLMIFTRQLAILTNSGISLVESLWTIALQTKNLDFKEKIVKIAEEIEAGAPLSLALSKHPQIFSPFFVNLIKTGEIVGKVPLCLNHLANYLERNFNFRQKLIGALIYPSIIFLFFSFVLLLLIFFIFPNFQRLFLEENIKPSFLINFFFSFSSFFRKFFPFFLFFFLFLICLVFFGLRQKREIFDKFLLKFPILGSFFKKIFLAQISQALLILISGGVHLTLALESVSALINNSIYKKAISEIKEKIKEGRPLSFAFHSFPDLFPPFFIQMISSGERVGKLDLILTNLSDFLQNEIERGLESFLRLLEPILIIFISVFVGFLVGSVFISIYRFIATF